MCSWGDAGYAKAADMRKDANLAIKKALMGTNAKGEVYAETRRRANILSAACRVAIHGNIDFVEVRSKGTRLGSLWK